uniref:Secreted protein n=1 Tax=Cyprinus carpio carpio TaxID=630221 RepID=A0A9J8DMK1_CYPCA
MEGVRMESLVAFLLLTVKAYCRAKRRRDSCVQLSNGCHGEIQNIVSFTAEVGTEIALFFQRFDSQPIFALPQNSGFVPHIKLLRDSQSPLQLVSIHNPNTY